MKRVGDLVVAFLGLVVLSPIILTVALLVRAFLGSPILFQQERPGLDGELFGLVKFRTMSNSADSLGNSLSDSKRMTRFGRFLRSSSLDELPELWNVLLGQMSLVGPRPLLVEYLPRYTPLQNRRHEVLPGITGLAQVKGRNSLTWEEKFDLDVWYVNNQSLRLDAAILFWSIKTVLSRKGVHGYESETPPKFTGSAESK